MALQKWTCTRCDNDFQAPEWHCADGHAHTVKSKTYYMLDAPADKRDCKFSQTVVCNVVPERREVRGTETIVIPGTNVTFVRGLFETDDPQLQIGLNNRKHILQGQDGLVRWQEAYFSDQEKQELEQMKLKAEITRLQSEKNQLLAEVQAKTRKSVSDGRPVQS